MSQPTFADWDFLITGGSAGTRTRDQRIKSRDNGNYTLRFNWLSQYINGVQQSVQAAWLNRLITL